MHPHLEYMFIFINYQPSKLSSFMIVCPELKFILTLTSIIIQKLTILQGHPYLPLLWLVLPDLPSNMWDTIFLECWSAVIKLLPEESASQSEAWDKREPGWADFHKQPPELPRFDSITPTTSCKKMGQKHGLHYRHKQCPPLPWLLLSGDTGTLGILFCCLPGKLSRVSCLYTFPPSYLLNQDSLCGQQLLLLEFGLEGWKRK